MPLNIFASPPLPKSLPEGLEKEILKLRQCESSEEALSSAYNLLTQKYRGYRLQTITRIFEAFNADVDRLWARNGFLHCNNLNYLLKILLVGSQKFREEDIKFQWTLIHYLSPHEYVQVRVNDRWIDVDVWGRAYGIEFGNHAHGLHSGSLTAKN